MVNEIPLVLVSSGSTKGALQLHNGDIVAVGSDNWFNWLRSNSSFRFVSGFAGEDSFTARKHERYAGEFWYAYRKINGKLKNAYLGKTENLNVEKLLSVASKLSRPPKQSASKTQLINGYVSECITEQLGNEQSTSYVASEVIQEKDKQIADLQEQIKQLQSRSEKLKASEKQAVDQLCNCHADAFKAADILKAALKLKSNAGGAIKRQIEKALPLIDDI